MRGIIALHVFNLLTIDDVKSVGGVDAPPAGEPTNGVIQAIGIDGHHSSVGDIWASADLLSKQTNRSNDHSDNSYTQHNVELFI